MNFPKGFIVDKRTSGAVRTALLLFISFHVSACGMEDREPGQQFLEPSAQEPQQARTQPSEDIEPARQQVGPAGRSSFVSKPETDEDSHLAPPPSASSRCCLVNCSNTGRHQANIYGCSNYTGSVHCFEVHGGARLESIQGC